MRRWPSIAKRILPRRKMRTDLSSMSSIAFEECFLLQHELSSGPNLFFLGGDGSFLAPSNCYYPLIVATLHQSKYSSDTVEFLWPLLLLALHTTDVSLSLSEAHLFSGTSVMGYHCVRIVVDRLKRLSSTMSFHEDFTCIRLVMSLVASPLCLDDSFLVEIRNFHRPIPGYILRLILSLSVTPSILDYIMDCELRKYSGKGIGPGPFVECLSGLLCNDHFFSSVHFQEMHAIAMNIVNNIGPSFDFLSIQWTPLLSKLSRVYMRQYEGESLAILHFKLLEMVPALETKMPLAYLVRVLGSLVDVCAEREDTRSLWRTIIDVASLAVRLHGNSQGGLQSIWKPFFKAAVTSKPTYLNYERVLEAYHVCAFQGNPLTLDRAAFSQVVRFLVGSINHLSLEETSASMRNFYCFLKEHPSVNFLWVLDSLLSLLSEIWKIHGEIASVIVQEFIKALQDDYFPSMRLSGVQLCDNPQIRPLLEKFCVVNKTEFWWECGCGTQIPASAKKCLMCLRKRNAAWTCVTCGAEYRGTDVEKSCMCGSENPRRLKAASMGLELCMNCGDVVLSSSGCIKCGYTYCEEIATRECSFCGKSYSQRAVCCPLCYAANEDKKPLLWRCDECEEYNHWTWSKCQRCPGRRRVGCIVTPLEPWVCGCRRRNHPCITGCETCSRAIYGAYTCNFCKSVSSKHSVFYLTLQSIKIRVIACQHCGHIHPRDQNVLCSPYLQRQCHQCGKKYLRSNLPLDSHCEFCNAFLRYNELNPFKCNSCEFKSLQTGFHCVSCLTPRSDLQFDDVYVWKCSQEILSQTALVSSHVCGHWNYSWLSKCRFCGGGRAQSVYENRVRCSSWVCSECLHQNLPTDVFFCSRCNTGLQLIENCFICGIPHLNLTCAPNILDDTL
ncbi:hypothetical protein BCY84_00556 [Trypanosoma cruzi cruzi]|uniref:RanBP2-type domain-containing protein n=1 Tax=Trypanosoma cruzi TaxID=5693 RepID=A0A2V2VQY9_TRYCR|nr:hypothetical protein BCY84_00556 [Trypanosoma cruzi cruzi]PWU98805.1 hypothetical protein C4B63_11g265 [Trypanosoma cruzi]